MRHTSNFGDATNKLHRAHFVLNSALLQVVLPVRLPSTDADTRLYRKGKTASELRFMGHTLSDNRHGLIASAMVTQADSYVEREAAKAMAHDARQATLDEQTVITLGADKGYDAQEFIDACLAMDVTPHVAQNTSGRRSAVPDVIVQTNGYAMS